MLRFKIYFSFLYFVSFYWAALASDQPLEDKASPLSNSISLDRETLNITFDTLSDRYIESIKEKKEVNIECKLDQFRPVNMDSLGFYLDRIDEQNQINDLIFENGTSQKFNLLFVTLYKIYMRHYENDRSISIYFSTNNHKTRAPEKLKNFPDATLYISYDGPKTVKAVSPNSKNSKQDKNKIIKFGAKVEKNLFKGEIDQFKLDNPWNCEKYGSSEYFGIDENSLIFQTLLTGSEAISKLNEWIKIDSNLIKKVINLSQSNIENEDLMSLKSLLVEAPSVVILDLSYTTLNSSSFMNLIEILRNNNLKFINVNNTDLFDDYLEEGTFPKFLRLCLNESTTEHPLIERLIWLDIFDEKCAEILRTLNSMDNRLPVEKILENHMLYYQLDTYVKKIVEKNRIIEFIESVQK